MEKRKFGDRKDAKRIRNVQSMNQIMIDLKPNRNLGEVYVNQKIDVTNLMEYYEECKKKNPNDNITLFHMFAMAIAKTIYNRPLLTRFVANRHVYEHNELIISWEKGKNEVERLSGEEKFVLFSNGQRIFDTEMTWQKE